MVFWVGDGDDSVRFLLFARRRELSKNLELIGDGKRQCL